ncbi:MAG: DUF433 domain-containing protein [Candidatus Hydrothermarchaeales archaeon]
MVKLTERIEINPKILGGKAVIKGTRIPVYLILELLAGGYDFKKILDAYPALKVDDITVAIEYATKLVKNEETLEYGVA